MKDLIPFTITESEMKSTLYYTTDTVQQALYPLAHFLARDFNESVSRPFCAALSGPPGSGKSAISSVLKGMIEERGTKITVLPLDGFHLRNEKLAAATIIRNGEETSLLAVKGARETYDVEKLIHCLKMLKSGASFHWPLYSRTTHQPVEQGLFIDNVDTLYLIEGNYLLLDLDPWNLVPAFFERKIFISSRERFVRWKIIRRKQRGGYSRRESRNHYRRSDRYNFREIMTYSKNYDYLIRQDGRFSYTLRATE